MRNLPLHWKIIIGLLAGIAWAVVGTHFGINDFTLDWIAPFGTIFINLLKLIAVPLVLFSVIKGMMDLKDINRLGRMGIKTLSLYLVTTVFAVSVGLAIVNIIKPGEAISDDQRIPNRLAYELWLEERNLPTPDGLHFLSDARYAAYLDQAKIIGENQENSKEVKKGTELKQTASSGPLQFLIDMVPSNIFLSLNDTLMLQVIFFAIFFGITLVLIPSEKAKPVNGLVDGMNEVFLRMVDVIMKAAPFFVFALMAGKLTEMSGGSLDGMLELFKGLSVYMITIIAGLAFMVFLIYPMLYAVLAGRRAGLSYSGSFKAFFRGMAPAQLLAFSTSSSAATLPVTMECVKDRMGVSDEVSSFVLPIGATVNMDGTSLYQAVAVVFLAQMHFIDLSAAQQFTIVLTATLASIGSAAVPSAGLIMLIMVLESVGLPAIWIAIIFPVDRILDMCRTVVNVSGDAAVCSIIAASEGEFKAARVN